MSRSTQETATARTPEQIGEILDAIAGSFRESLRSPILHSPAEAGLAYEDVSFPSQDGVPLEGWFIPAEGSEKIIIANHPRWFSRSGLPSHLEPWKSLAGAAGNDFEVNFVPDYKILHDAGYHVLAYDLRNFGHSGAANGGLFTVGRFESRDVLGSLRYIRTRPDTRDMTIGLFSRCVGGNATMFAMTTNPEAFRVSAAWSRRSRCRPVSHSSEGWSASGSRPTTSMTWSSASGCTPASRWRTSRLSRGRSTS